jgi:hypothetical protein
MRRVMLSLRKIIFATVLIAHAVSVRAEPNYAPNWDARKCAGLDELIPTVERSCLSPWPS